jgi:hypothetical protein
MSTTKRRRRRIIFSAIGVILLVLIAYACVPRTANMRGFDPAEVARLETGMWRDYYQHKRLPLVIKLYQTLRGQYGFSPLDSARIGWLAGKAAIVFKDSKSETEADLALPPLRDYFDLINRRTGKTFDVGRAARLELEWWKARRRKDSNPLVYGHVVAEATAEVYGVSAPSIESYAQLRAAAMDYRDKRGQSITDDDWNAVERMLVQSFSQLKSVVGKTTRNADGKR